jgi:hypothetical protein
VSFRDSAEAKESARLPTDAMEREFVSNIAQIALDVPLRIKRTMGKARLTKTRQTTVVTVSKNGVWGNLPVKDNHPGWPAIRSDKLYYWSSSPASAVPIQKQDLKLWLTLRPEVGNIWKTAWKDVEINPAVAATAENSVGIGFLPSVELTDFWVRGLKRRLRKVRSEIDRAKINLSPNSTEARYELGQMVERIISVIGYRQQHGIDDFSEFGRAGRFDDSVTDQFLNRVPISGDEATPFLALLYSELLQHLRSREIAGAWGALSASGRNIDLTTKPAEVELLSQDWKVASVLE